MFAIISRPMNIINNENMNEGSENLEIKNGRIEKVSFIILLVSIFLTPLVFTPSGYLSLDIIKTVIITFGILVSAILYFVSAWKNKELYLPKHPLVLTAIGLAISAMISTFVSSNVGKSFFGQGFEITTTSFLLLMFFTSLITIYLANRNKERIIHIFSAILVAFIVLFLYELLRLFAGADTMSFGIFTTLTSTFIGRWSDFGVLAGLVAVLSYVSLNLLNLSKLFKTILYIVLVAAALVLVVINYPIIWLVFAVTIFGIIVYQYQLKSQTASENTFGAKLKRIPLLSVIFLIIALLFVFNAKKVGDMVVAKLDLSSTEVVFPWQLTLDVTSETIKESPLFGSGPNRFNTQYLKFKPLEVNLTPFYEYEFSQGFGFIPTAFVTQGLVGGILWIIFTILFIVTGVKELRKKNDTLPRFFVASTYFGTLFLWLISLVMVPGHAILFLTFVLLGLFMSAINVAQYRPSSKIILPLVVIAVVISLAWLSIYVKKTLALSYFQKGIASLNVQDANGISNAESNFKKALLIDESDIYYQALSETTLRRVSSLVQTAQQSGQKTIPQETVDEILKQVETAKNYTDKAIATDPTNYYNYISSSRVYEVGMTLGVTNAYENLVNVYKQAISLNMFSPSLYLNLARIESAKGNYAQAEGYIGSALQLKQNYLDAIYLLSQIQVAQNKIGDAITSVQVASQLNPTNPLIFFQLGFLYYNANNFNKSIEAFTQALKLDPNYANAQYFIGLSYARLTQYATAAPYFEALAQTNPDNKEVEFILANLKANKAPFTQAQPPIDSKPEQRKTPPIKEKETTKKSTTIPNQ